MISLIQLEAHRLLEVEFKVHLDYEPSEVSEPNSLILQTRGETLQELGEPEPPYVRVNVATHGTPLHEDKDSALVNTVLLLEVNWEEEDREVTPYRLKLAIGGMVRAHNLPAEEGARKHAYRVVRANGAGLLYGIARQVSTSLSLQSGLAGLMLPSLNFQAVIEHEIEVEQANGDEHE